MEIIQTRMWGVAGGRKDATELPEGVLQPTGGIYTGEVRRGSGFRDPIGGDTIDASTTVFADDLAELNITPEVEDTANKGTTATTLLDRRLDLMEMGQNTSNAEHVVVYHGTKGRELRGGPRG